MKTLLTTSALVALISAPVIGQVDVGAETGAEAESSVSSGMAEGEVGLQAEAEGEVEAGAEGQGTAEGGTAINTDGMSEASAQAAAGMTGETLVGAEIYDAEANSVSTVTNVGVNAEGEVTHVLTDVGGFLGLGSRTVAVALSDVEIEQDAEGHLLLHLDMTSSEIEDLPEFEG